MTNSKCLVLLSGGQDSTTVAIHALGFFEEVHALTINYGQRHEIELESAIAVAKILKLNSHEIVDVPGILKSSSPLTSDNPVDTFDSVDDLPGGVANTFVPSRNAFFLTLAANRAIAMGIDVIYTGVCSTDGSGYPDCKRGFIDSLEDAISLGNFDKKGKFKIITPLMNLNKAESVIAAYKMMPSNPSFEDVFELTHTCYQGVKGGCGHCAACLLRDRGFKEAHIADPIWKFRKEAIAV